ncbi:MAG: zf-TFIIB domain-containing protein [Dehalococcoidia bacterium]
MKPMSDDAWVARLRTAYADHGDEFESALAAELAAAPPHERPQQVHGPCPFCNEHPPLQAFPARLATAASSLLYCPACYGFFAPAAALSSGITADAGDHPALSAAPAPARCRACFGFLMPDGRCAKCKQPVPPFECPACRVAMDRREGDGVTLDHCGQCGGTWFDMGELGAVFGIEDRPSLAERYAGQRSAESAALLGGLIGGTALHGGHNPDGAFGADSILSAVLQVVASLVRLRF